MTLSAGDYLLGAFELAVILGALAFAAWRVRALLLPSWIGAPARLVECVLGVVALIWLSELLGSLGLFEDAPMLVGALVVAAAAHLVAAKSAPTGSADYASPLPAPPSSRAAWACAAVAVAAVAAAWMVPTLQALAGGMDRADTLWYHMPLATRFVQTGDLTAIDYFDPIFFAAYYPANSEVLHATGILAFGRDIVSPLLNLGFLAIGLVASYCIGRPYGVGPHALLGGTIALGSQQLVEFQAGEALNDITGVAFLLAAVAVLVNADAGRTTTGSEGEGDGDSDRVAGDPRGIDHTGGARIHADRAALAIAGLSAGVAAGTKLSFLAPVLALSVGVALIYGRGARARITTFAWFTIPAALAGGFWYLRNAIAIGNPIPFTSWGPLDLPMPARDFELREPFSVAHYLTDFEVWDDWFFPGLDASFGVLWPLVILGFVGAGAYALWRGASPLMRVLGAVVLFTSIAYVFTPLTAAGEEGRPIAFEWNVRYIAPAAAIGLAILPVLVVGRGDPVNTEGWRGLVRRPEAVLVGLVVLAAATIGSLVQWDQGHAKGAILAGVGVLAGFGAVAWLLDRNLLGAAAPRRVAFALIAVAVVGALGAGWWEQRHYLERRYENLSPQLNLAEAVRWARGVEAARIAVAGVRGVFNQFPFYGTELSNEVQWLGIEGPDGAYLRIPDCETWRTELAAGDYDYVVTTYDPFDPPDDLTDTKEGLWTHEDAGAREVLRDGAVSVFELESPPDPSTCEGLPDLSEAELNGDSVNLDRDANQP